MRKQITHNCTTWAVLMLLLIGTYELSAQCPYGYKVYDIDGNASAVEAQSGVSSYNNILAAPDGSTARFYSSGNWIEIKLDHTINAGHEYSIVWQKRNDSDTDSARIIIEESIEGITWFVSGTEPKSLNETGFDTTAVTASTSTRYLRFTNPGDADFAIDAIAYDIDDCILNANPPNRIQGNVFEDTDGDGVLDGGESGIQFVSMLLFQDVNQDGILNSGDTILDTVETDISGDFNFNVPSLTTPSLNKVLNASDDAEEDPTIGDVYNWSWDLDFGHVSVGNPYVGAMRFDNVDIPPGTDIKQSYLKFAASATHSSSVNLTIYGEDEDDPISFSDGSGTFGITGRNKTDSSVAWNSPESWTVNKYYSSPDISSIVQEVVDRGGWSMGNAMVFIIEGGSGKREAFTFDAASLTPPILVIDTVGDFTDHLLVQIKYPAASTPTNSDERAISFDWCNQRDTVVAFGFQTWVLPIEWIHFEVNANERGAVLDWQTGAEINNEKFIIERNDPGSAEYKPIGEILSKGTGKKATWPYHYEDPLETEGMYYYRIKQIDFDGSTSESKTIACYYIDQKALRLFPNPSRQDVHLNLAGLQRGVLKIQVYNSGGHLVYEINDNTWPESIVIPSSGWKSGVYQVRVTGAAISFRSSFLLID